MRNKIRKAIIPAAGLGTRFLPATKAQPKEMLPIVDTPTIQYIVEEAINSGIKEILIITGRNKRSIEDHFDRSIELEMQLESQGKLELLDRIRKISDIQVHFIRQKETKGLGHAVLCARQFIGDEPFAVLLGDDLVYTKPNEFPCLKQLIQYYNEISTDYPKDINILGVRHVGKDNIHKYGIVKVDRSSNDPWRILDLVEKPNDYNQINSDLAILGRYILGPQIFNLLENALPGANGEIQLTDAIKKLSSYEHVYAHEFEGRRYDIGDKEGFLEATVEYALRSPELHDKFNQFLLNTIRSK